MGGNDDDGSLIGQLFQPRGDDGGRAVVEAGERFVEEHEPGPMQERPLERKRLIARREKLFQDLVKLENDRRRGRVDERRYAVRREELVAALETVYGGLDGDDTSPGPADRAGLAA